MAYLHPRDGPGLPGENDDSLCNSLRTAVQVVLGAYQVVAETAQKLTGEHNWHLICPADTAPGSHYKLGCILQSRLVSKTDSLHSHDAQVP